MREWKAEREKESEKGRGTARKRKSERGDDGGTERERKNIE